MTHLMLLAGGPVPSLHPTASLPGTSTLVTLLNGLLDVVLALSLAGLLVSAAMMAFGHHSSNSRAADRGRQGAVASIIAVVLAGGATALLNFAFSTGSHIH